MHPNHVSFQTMKNLKWFFIRHSTKGDVLVFMARSNITDRHSNGIDYLYQSDHITNHNVSVRQLLKVFPNSAKLRSKQG